MCHLLRVLRYSLHIVYIYTCNINHRRHCLPSSAPRGYRLAPAWSGLLYVIKDAVGVRLPRSRKNPSGWRSGPGSLNLFSRELQQHIECVSASGLLQRCGFLLNQRLQLRQGMQQGGGWRGDDDQEAHYDFPMAREWSLDASLVSKI